MRGMEREMWTSEGLLGLLRCVRCACKPPEDILMSKELETGRIKGNSGQTWLVSVLVTMAERTVVVRFRASLDWYRCLWVLMSLQRTNISPDCGDVCYSG
ncbi:hypothetical protein WUBG_04352 [Wuchereria bancrofti]|uniref:Uncharacterized protein n=1 Tax=Wuchereria bancrofti TaxID=6293 RepID=J9ERB4_WUCBA|nr:hypothetical protein WUBG_04352 [Wuchereria bancrofti]